MKRLLFLFLTIFTIGNLSAQDQFERLYRSTERQFLGMDVRQTGGGGYLLLSIVRNSDTQQLTMANVTNLDPKGNINWSKDYDFEEELKQSGDLILLENDSFIFSVVLENSELNNVVTKAAPNGDVVWSNAYGDPDFLPLNLPVITENDLTRNWDSGYSIFGQQGQSSNSGIYGTRLDSLGNQIWAKNYVIDAINPLALNGVQDAQITQDSGFILGGRTSEFASQADILLIKLDSLGEVVWSNRYGNSSPFQAKLGEAVVQTPDNGYAVAGWELDGDLVFNFNGFVMKTDSVGEVLWYNLINVDSLQSTDCRFTDIALNTEGNIVVSGFAKAQDEQPYAIFMEFDQNGDVINDQKYNEPVSETEDMSIAVSSDDTPIIYGTYRDLDNVSIPYLIKGNASGESSCSDTLVYELTQFDTIPTLPISFLTENLDTVLLKEPLVMNYDSFSVPVLALNQPPPFCEGDPINVTFDATVEGGVSYEWSTGETTPMITVMEEGLYTVDVRVEEDICFNLCDTVVISVIGPPTVSIAQDLSPFCTDGVGVLEAQIQGFANEIQWSTGDTESVILIDEIGTYGVTVTNQCGSSEAQVTISEFPEVLPSFSVAIDDSGLCEGQEGIIVADVFNGDFATVTWTTADGEIISGANSTALTVGSTGTYTISAANNCGTSTENVVLTADQPTVNIAVITNDICVTDTAEITFNGTNFSQFVWSTGETENQQIIVTGQNTYSVTVSNSCGDTASDAITFACEFPFDECVQIPNAFTPNNDQTNDGFRPVIPDECATGITIRRLTVWSRWGKKVFDEMSADPVWDGTEGGEPLTADVYIYLVEAVNDNDEERVFKGDVTLIR